MSENSERFLDSESTSQVKESIEKIGEIDRELQELEARRQKLLQDRESYIGNIKLYEGLDVYRENLAKKGKTTEEIEGEVGPWERGEKR